MKVAKIVGAVVLGLVVIILIAAALKPADYAVTREVEIHGTPMAIFPHINNPKLADEWMPWSEVDPTTQMTYSGPDAGVGAISSWVSTKGMGTGSAEVVESVPNEKVATRLVYTKPMQMEQLSLITLSPTGEQVIVRWSVTGKNSYLGRVMCLFSNMDKMVGGMFERGLAKLKSKVEASGK